MKSNIEASTRTSGRAGKGKTSHFGARMDRKRSALASRGRLSPLRPNRAATVPPALARLRRLRGRPQFITHEDSVEATRAYLSMTGIDAPWTFVALPFPDHTDTWVLRDLPERRRLREWVAGVVEGK